MQGARTARLAAAAACAVVALGVGACGDEENAPGAPEGVPAAGANTPPSGTPGVPEGASYDVDGYEWQKLTQKQRFEAASDFIAASSPGRCKGADVGQVVGYTTDSYGFDFPRDIEAAEVLAEGCDASVQS
jgi:hypothetical protein